MEPQPDIEKTLETLAAQLREAVGANLLGPRTKERSRVYPGAEG
jgi:hypothetical protein